MNFNTYEKRKLLREMINASVKNNTRIALNELLYKNEPSAEDVEDSVTSLIKTLDIESMKRRSAAKGTNQ